ncbi:hypothetical protein FACS1894120_5630 [Clostridia bacterium]|nr:hypothetical protein FACS1894120_5630 [Clostridia bacterium]
MREEIIYSFRSPYRDDFRIPEYSFHGGGTPAPAKTCTIVGGLRGSETLQMYVCASLINELSTLEREGAVAKDAEIAVIPAVNHYAMNSGKKFCTKCDKDINRAFPGRPMAENIDRIASAVFTRVSERANLIHVTGGSLPRGSYCAHLGIEDCPANEGAGELFRLPYYIYDTAQKDERREDSTFVNCTTAKGLSAVSLYVNSGGETDEPAVRAAVCGMLLFLRGKGILTGCGHLDKAEAEITARYSENCGSLQFGRDKMHRVVSTTGGFLRRLKHHGQLVKKGDILGEILHPYQGTVLTPLSAPVSGLIIYNFQQSLISERCLAFTVIEI